MAIGIRVKLMYHVAQMRHSSIFYTLQTVTILK